MAKPVISKCLHQDVCLRMILIRKKEGSQARRCNWQNAQEASVFRFQLEGGRPVVLRLLHESQPNLRSLLKISLLGPISLLCQNRCGRAWAAALLTNPWDIFIPFQMYLSPFFIIFSPPFSIFYSFPFPVLRGPPLLNIYWISTLGWTQSSMSWGWISEHDKTKSLPWWRQIINK